MTLNPFNCIYSESVEEQMGWVQPLLAQFTYKPNWSFHLQCDPAGNGLWIVVEFAAVDSYGHELGDLGWPDMRMPERYCCRSCGHLQNVKGTIPVNGKFLVPPFCRPGCDPDRFFDWLRHMILDVEQHEADEWFKINGEPPFDPHRAAGTEIPRERIKRLLK